MSQSQTHSYNKLDSIDSLLKSMMIRSIDDCAFPDLSEPISSTVAERGLAGIEVHKAGRR